PRLLFGLAGGSDLEAVEVTWPDGRAERFPPPPLGAYATLRRGQGRIGEATTGAPPPATVPPGPPGRR
ncbi:MAG: ASPIC/UnbV domain-containing protein, partial [Thermoanaerobaculia bacterium]|nr:ASPIC/UnbV domain-containing protein [Thermoanaerobaculia bacterium]